MYSKKAIFHLPGVFRYDNIYNTLLSYKAENPHHFKDNVEIGSLYGSPTCIWNGGRAVHGITPNRAELVNENLWAQKFGVPIRFTFTNQCIEDIHCYDAYGNTILDVFKTGNNEIIVNSPILENYIRSNYGDSYRYISSTTKRLINVDEQREEFEKDYSLVVLDYDHNKNIDFIKSLPDKGKCEILCNPVCFPNCAQRSLHYQKISECQLKFEPLLFRCNNSQMDFFNAMKQPNFISVEDIENVYLPLGISNFKLEGRTTYFLDLVEILLYYLIKEEYKMELRYRFYQLI